MKKSFILMSLVLGALALTSCNNVDENVSIAKKGNFTFKVAADTRAGISNNSVVWQDGDKIDFGAVETGSTETETAANVFSFAGDNSFSGTANISSSKTYDFYAFFPSYGGKFFLSSRESNPNAYSKYVNFGDANIAQTGETMDHVMQYAPMFGSASSKSPENLTIAIHHLAAMLDFTIVNNSENAIVVKSLQMTTPETVKFCGTYYASFDGTVKPSGDQYVYNSCTVSVSNGASVAKGGSFHVYMPVAPFALANGSKVSFKITADSGVCEISKTLTKDVTFTAGTISTQSLEFAAAAPVTYSTISSITGAGNYTVENVKVLAVSGSNAIVGDATGNAILYGKNLTIAAGNTVTLSGDVKVFNGVYEFDSPSITITDASTTIDRGTPAAFGDSELSAYAGNPTIAFVKASGKMDDNRSINFTNGYFWLYNENNSVGKYSSFTNKDVDVTGYTFGFQDKSGKTSVSFMITEIKEKGSVTPPAPSGDYYTWDLSKASYSDTSAKAVNWISDYATMQSQQGTSKNSAANYVPGNKDNRTSSRVYNGNILTITPAAGYTINKIEFTATSTSYASDFAASSWTNAAAAVNGTTVTVTPQNESEAVSAAISKTAGFTAVTIYYGTGTSTPKVLTGIAVNGQTTSFLTGATFAFDGTCTATYEGGSTKVVTPTSVSSPDMSSAGSKTVTVSYTENGVTKTAQYTITVTANVSTGGKYVRVTSSAELTNGQYLIVCDTTSVALNGALSTFDAIGNTVAVTISGNSIDATTALKSAEFTYSSTDGSFKGTSGKYIGQTKNDNGLATSDTAFANTVTVQSNGDVTIACAAGAVLRFNAASNQLRFRYFKSSSYTNQKSICLYKYTN